MISRHHPRLRLEGKPYVVTKSLVVCGQSDLADITRRVVQDRSVRFSGVAPKGKEGTSKSENKEGKQCILQSVELKGRCRNKPTG